MALEELEEKGSEGLGKKEESSEMIQLSKQDFEKLMSRIDDVTNQEKTVNKAGNSGSIDMESIGKMFQGMLSNQNKKSAFTEDGQFNFTEFGNEEIGEDDYLEKEDWRVFVAFRVLHVIADDKKNGRPVKAPLGMIRFNYTFTQRDQVGKEVNIVNVSQYICKSKAVLKFLLNHSEYGISFYDRVDMTLAKSSSSMSLVRKMSSLKTLGQQDLRQLTVQYPQVKFTAELDEVRIQLAQAMVEEEQGLAKKATLTALNSTYLAKQELGEA